MTSDTDDTEEILALAERLIRQRDEARAETRLRQNETIEALDALEEALAGRAAARTVARRLGLRIQAVRELCDGDQTRWLPGGFFIRTDAILRALSEDAADEKGQNDAQG